jgi:hypothetical protein
MKNQKSSNNKKPKGYYDVVKSTKGGSVKKPKRG